MPDPILIGAALIAAGHLALLWVSRRHGPIDDEYEWRSHA